MRARIAGLLGLAVITLTSPAAAQEPVPLKYRLAVGMNPGLGMPGGFGLSASRDVYQRGSRLTMRLDATAVSDERNRGMSAVSLDATYGIPIWRIVAYPIAGLAATTRVGPALIGGGGADFEVHGRTLFAEMRFYEGFVDRGTAGFMKLGFRFR